MSEVESETIDEFDDENEVVSTGTMDENEDVGGSLLSEGGGGGGLKITIRLTANYVLCSDFILFSFNVVETELIVQHNIHNNVFANLLTLRSCATILVFNDFYYLFVIAIMSLPEARSQSSSHHTHETIFILLTIQFIFLSSTVELVLPPTTRTEISPV